MATESTAALPSGTPVLEPSKVLHLRNLPEEITEHDIRRIASDYGTVSAWPRPSPPGLA